MIKLTAAQDAHLQSIEGYSEWQRAIAEMTGRKDGHLIPLRFIRHTVAPPVSEFGPDASTVRATRALRALLTCHED